MKKAYVVRHKKSGKFMRIAGQKLFGGLDAASTDVFLSKKEATEEIKFASLLQRRSFREFSSELEIVSVKLVVCK